MTLKFWLELVAAVTVGCLIAALIIGALRRA